MEEFLLKVIMQNSNRKIREGDSELITIVLSQCYLLSPELERIRPSFVAFENCFKWGGTIENSLSSALLTLNSKHGPFSNSYDLINKYIEKGIANFKEYVILELSNGKMISGFGNPLIKSRDGRCLEIQQLLDKYRLVYTECSNEVEKYISVYSNLSFWVASVMHYLGLSREYASLLPILSFSICYVNKVSK